MVRTFQAVGNHFWHHVGRNVELQFVLPDDLLSAVCDLESTHNVQHLPCSPYYSYLLPKGMRKFHL